MTLIVENVKKEYVEAFKGLSSGVKANMKVFVEYNDNVSNTNDNLTKNDYTDELKKEVLADKTQNNTNERIANV
ncbi:hypothetical protein [Helicobacter bilis]|uniref:hypothetical protein n=1 Tax=Helicobacter bilis TaxID=37372 RepID=UPI00248DCCE2|nr:hypothetical protein [Helicobacter bilis]